MNLTTNTPATQEELKLRLMELTSVKTISFGTPAYDAEPSEISTPKSVAAVQFSTKTRLRVMDRKIYNVLIRYAMKDIRENSVFRIPVALVANWIGMKGRLDVVYPAVERLQESQVKFDIFGEDEVSKIISDAGLFAMSSSLLASCALTKDKKMVEYSFSHHLRWVLSYPKRYVNLNFATQNTFSSIYHLSLYENLLVDFIPQKAVSLSRYYTCEELADALLIPTSEQKTFRVRGLAYLKSKLIKKAIETINANDTCEFMIAPKLKEEKRGKELHRVAFILTPKPGFAGKNKNGVVTQILEDSNKLTNVKKAILSYGFDAGEVETILVEKQFEHLYEVIQRIKFAQEHHLLPVVTKDNFFSFLKSPESIPGNQSYVEEHLSRNQEARKSIQRTLEEKRGQMVGKGGERNVGIMVRDLFQESINPTKVKELEIFFIENPSGCQIYGEDVQALYTESFSISFSEDAERLFYFWVYDNYEMCSKFLNEE